MNTTPRRAWSAPVEVPATEMQHRTTLKPERYAFWTDVQTRLEQTNPGAAIRYTFVRAEEAESYRVYVSSVSRDERGKGALHTRVRLAPDGGAYLYVKRGPNW